MDSLLHAIDPLYLFSGALVGTLVGFTGVGGGSLMTPILILVFGISPAGAVGTDLVFAAATKSAGSLVHGRKGAVDWRVVMRLAAGSVPASAATTLLLYRLGVGSHETRHLITGVLGIALSLTALLLIFRKPLLRLTARRVGAVSPELARMLTVITGVVLGVLVTLSSVGAGAIGVTALVLLYPQMPAGRIVGTDIAHAVPLTLVAGIGHSILGTIDLQILASLLCGSVPAILVSSALANRVPEAALRLTLACVLLLVSARFWFLG